MRRYWIFIVISLFGLKTSAQQLLNLEDAIRQMKQNNTQLRVQQEGINLSQTELEGTSSGFLPRISAGYTGLFSNDPLNAFGFLLQQRSITAQHFDPAFMNRPGSQSNFNTKLSIQQPILNFDAIAAKNAMKQKLRATEYQKQFAEENLEVEIKNAYTNLQFLYQAQKAVDKGIEAYRETLRNTENMEEAGYAKSSDVLYVKVGLGNAENQKIDIGNNIANLSDYLSWLMGTEAGTIYQPDTDLNQNYFTEASGEFSTDRADILAMQSGIEAQKGMAEMQKKSLLPRLNAFGDFNLNDKAAFNFGANNYLTGFSLTWDIFKGNEMRNKIRQSQVSTRKAQTELQLYTEQQQLALNKAKRDLESNQAKVVLAQTAVKQSAEALRILLDRYNEGLEKTSDTLVAQATDLEKQVDYLNAVKEYNLTVIQIKFLTQQNN